MSQQKPDFKEIISLPGGRFIARGTKFTKPPTSDGLRSVHIEIERSMPNPTISLNVYALGPRTTPFALGNFLVSHPETDQTVIDVVFSNTETDDTGPIATKVDYYCDYIIIG